jgi:hypothetical protein
MIKHIPHTQRSRFSYVALVFYLLLTSSFSALATNYSSLTAGNGSTGGNCTLLAPAGKLISISITNAAGKTVSQVRGNAGDTRLQLDLSHLPKGVYIIKTQTTSQKVMLK